MRWTSFWRAGLVSAVLVLCMGLFASEAQAFMASSFSTSAYGTISNISVTPTSTTKSEYTTWTVGFTTENAIPSSGGRIVLNLHGASWTSDTFSSATLSSLSSPSTLSVVNRYGNYMELSTSSTIAAGTAFTLKLNDVKNPAKGGRYFLKVNTTKYGEAIDGSTNWNGDYISPSFTIGTNTNFSGTVTNSSSQAVPFASVSIYSSDYQNYFYGSTDKNGLYGFGDVPAGTYTMYVYAPSSWNTGSTATIVRSPAPSTVTVGSSNVTQNASFTSPTKTLTVTVKRSNGTAVSGANLYASSYTNGSSGYGNAKTGSDGTATFTMPGGDWSIGVYSDYGADWVTCGSNSYHTINFKDDATTESKSDSFSVTSQSATLKGKVTKPDGTGVGQYQASLSFSNSDGCSAWASSDSSGNFSTKAVPGTYSVSGYSSDNSYSFPKVNNVTVGDNESLDLGTIKLIEKTDTITGTIKDNLGNTVSGASVNAWRNDGTYDWANTTTATDGAFTLKVTPGKWQVSAWPSWSYSGSQEYLSDGEPQTVEVKSGVASTINFTFQKATNTITGTVTDEDGNVLTSLTSGGVGASDGSKTWSQVWGTLTNGTYTLKVPDGTWNISLYLWGGEYSSGDPVSVKVSDNASKTVTLKALKNDVTIQGTVYDEDNNKVTGKWMSIYATKNQNSSWRNATLDTSAGTYTMKVSAGKWRLGWWVDYNSGYASGNGEDVEIDAKAGETKTYDLTLRKANATISGTAKKADGTAMQWAWITADTRDPNEKTKASDKYYTNGASAGTDGKFSIKLPAGTYWVGGSMWVGSGYINPKRQKLTVEKDGTATVDLVFREADASIDGTVKLDGVVTGAFITAWGEDGGYAETTAGNSGAYKLSVASGTTWHVKAIKESGSDVYKSAEVLVDLSGGKQASKDLELKKQSYSLPDAESFTFDPTVSQTFELNDGTLVSIPANTVATDGTATLAVVPDADLAEQDNNRPLTYGYDLDMTVDGAAVTDFAGNVTIAEEVTASELTNANILDTGELQMGYFDDATSSWIALDNCTVSTTATTTTAATISATDTVTVTCQVDHFTKFAVLASADTTPPGPPTNVKAANKGSGGAIGLTWTNPTETDFKSISIYRSTVDGQIGSAIKTGVTGTSYDDTGLTDGTTYYYTLRAVDTSGNESSNATPASGSSTGKAGETGVTQVAVAPSSSGGTTVAAASTTTLPKAGAPATASLGWLLLALPGVGVGAHFLRRRQRVLR